MRIVIRNSRVLLGLTTLLALSLAALYVGPRPDTVQRSLPEGFSDAEYWSLIESFSEPSGHFRSENFVSNEKTFQHVIPVLKRNSSPDGIYVGVGPDQNFTYIAALRPKLAFIVDVRRQNMMLHLMYKALFELSANRQEFLSKLFSRQIAPGLSVNASAEKLLKAVNAAPHDSEAQKENVELILAHLTMRRQFPLSLEDSSNIEYVYGAFASGGPQIRYSFPNAYTNRRRFPSYTDLMQETDEEGEAHSYLASEENFQFVRKLHSANRIVPLVGNFAGDKALRMVGRFLRTHQATLTAFYTSNVEFYLFQSGDWKKFANNVAAMPIDDDSLFIRAYFNTYGPYYPNQPQDARSVTLLDNIGEMLGAYHQGRIREYFDVVRRSGP